LARERRELVSSLRGELGPDRDGEELSPVLVDDPTHPTVG
jgi:hypothetical protein